MDPGLKAEDPGSSESDSTSDRANRWDGPPSTWRAMNREEITTITALNQVRNQDLSAHLYNAFALKKHRHDLNDGVAPVPGQDINAATGQKVEQNDWLPQRTWTAWPMSAETVPQDDYTKRADDEDDRFTIRRPVVDLPSVALEENITATILRFAKEKFNSRPWEDQDMDALFPDQDAEDVSDVSSATTATRSRSRSRSRSRPLSIKQENPTEDGKNPQIDEMVVDASEDPENGIASKEVHLQPIVSADDELSYSLLRPTARSILTKLDATLGILHNGRKTTMDYLSDSSSDSEEPTASMPRQMTSRKGSEPPARRGRGRRPKAGLGRVIRAPPLETSQDDSQPDVPRKKGRPRKVYPRLENETDREYAMRIARQRREPVPIFPSADSGDEASGDDSDPPLPPRRSVKRKASKNRDPSSDALESRQVQHHRTAARLGLRDWRDVISAAALAGFPPAALDRAARRCADLFGQNMELRALEEGAIGQAGQDTLVSYRPGMAATAPPHSDEASDDGDDRLSQAERRIRSSSIVSDESRGSRRTRSVSRGRGRSRSRSVSVACSHFCRVRGCSRVVDGFSRRSNLLRHMKLVHDVEGDKLPSDVDSEDEMVGAVHVDGFLKPLKIRKGWRGDDVAPRSPVKHRDRGGRSGSRPGPDDAVDDPDVVMGEDS